MKPLTAKQAAILNYIMDHVEQNGYPPSVNDLRVHLNLSGMRSAAIHLDALQAKGYIERKFAGSRAIKILRDPKGVEVALRFCYNE